MTCSLSRSLLCVLALAAPVRGANAEASDAKADASRQTAAVEARPVPPLKEVLARAASRAPQVLLGRAALGVSRTTFVNALRAPMGNPYFELTGQHGTLNTTKDVSVGLTLWLPFELVGQRGKRIDEAAAYVDLHEATLEAAEATALGEALSAYGAAVVAAERVRVLEAVEAMSRTTAEMYDARVQAGDAITTDARIARVELAKNQVMLQDARGRLAWTLSELSRFTGERYDRADAENLHPPALDTEKLRGKAGAEGPPSVAMSEAEARYFATQSDRLEREAVGPFTLMLLGGRGDFGEARVGAGLAYSVPVVLANQGDRARADAEKLRALTERQIRQSYYDARLRGVAEQLRQVRGASDVISSVALPAAREAVDAAVQTLEAGKGDWFVVLVSRRDFALLSLQRLDLIEKQWALLGELVQLTGELP